MTDHTNDAVRVKGLSKTFHTRHKRSGQNNDVHAVRDISLTVGQAECLGIAGESGSGKSTLARMLVGLEVPSSGTITVNGETLPEPPKAADRKRDDLITEALFGTRRQTKDKITDWIAINNHRWHH